MPEAVANDERRSAYRVQPTSTDELNLSVLGESRQRICGKITDVAVGGARVCFDGHDAPKLTMGDHIVLAFSSLDHAYDGNVLAKVVSMSVDAGQKVVQLAFDKEHEPLNLKRDELFTLFNRRHKVRGIAGSLNDDLRASISVVGAGETTVQNQPVSILNISNAGVSFSIDNETSDILKDETDVRLTLERLEDGSVNKVACIVRHRSNSRGSYAYGCEYDWGATVDPLAVVEDFVTYLIERPDEE